MNLSLANITAWISGITPTVKELEEGKEIIVAASFPYLALLKEWSQQSTVLEKGVKIAAQNIYHENKGAHTGEVGAFQIKDFCKYSIIGHSERKEPAEIVKKKRDLCIAEGITPIVCFVDENTGKELYHEKAFMAWEDPSNISVNGVYHAKDPAEIVDGVKKLKSIFPKDTVLIYGGSVNRDNSKSLSMIEELNGVLVGNASNDPLHFADIISNCK